MNFGKYELLGLLGQGGMGQVYLAKDRTLGRQVALKVLAKEIQSDTSVVLRFLKEAQLSAGLSHPNIVILHDFGTELGTPYIAMEYLRGESLKVYIEKKVPLLWSQKLELALQIARGLEHAHQHNIVHRDIKPSNIQILPKGEVKVLDFGIAKVAAADRTQLTETGVIIGTPGYASPEQVRGFPPVTTSSDVFSFGIVLYELLGYRKAFVAEDTMSLLFKIVFEEPAPLQFAILPEVGAGLQELIAQCLLKDPEQRPRTMGPVVQKLRQLQKRLMATEQELGDLPEDLEDSPWLAGQHMVKPISPEVLADFASRTLTNPSVPSSVPQSATLTLAQGGVTSTLAPVTTPAPPPSATDATMTRPKGSQPMAQSSMQAQPLASAASLAPPPTRVPDISEWTAALAAPAAAVEAPIALSPQELNAKTGAKLARPLGSVLDSNLKGISELNSSILELERRISGEVPRKEFSVLNDEVRKAAGLIDKMFTVGNSVEWVRADSSGKRLFHAKITARAGTTTIHIEENLEHVASSLMLGWLLGGAVGSIGCIAAGIFLRQYQIPAFLLAVVPLLLAAIASKRAFEARSKQRVQELRRLLERLSNHVSRTVQLAAQADSTSSPLR